MLSLDSLIAILADGEFHSGVELGESQSVSRTAIWKSLQKLQELGIPVETVKGKGYRIPGGINLLRPAELETALPPDVRSGIDQLTVLTSTDSTNAWLLQQAQEHGIGRCRVCMAEYQSAGRGRRGRNWISPFGQNIYLSIGYTLDAGFAALEGLSLAVGVMVVEALAPYRIPGLQLKWPNDIWVGGRKLGGVLIELSGEQSGPCHVIIGLGLNVFMERGEGAAIEQAWTTLSEETDVPIERNQLAARLVEALVRGMALFEREGFALFRERWQQLDALRDRVVTLSGVQGKEGICRGIGRFGHLLLETPSGIEEIAAGEVSLRPS